MTLSSVQNKPEISAASVSEPTLLQINDQSQFLVQPPEWIERLRLPALEQVGLQPPLPSVRSERWKFTDLRRLRLEETFMPTGTHEIGGYLVEGSASFPFDDYFASDFLFPALPDGVIAARLRDIDCTEFLGKIAASNDEIVAANTAGMADGFVVIVPRGVHLSQPIEVWFNNSGPATATHLRLLIVLEDNASVTLIEGHTGWGVSTLVSEIQLGEGARLNHYRINETQPNAVRIATGGIRLEKDAHYEAFSLVTGGRLSRHQVKVELNGPGAHVELNGAHVLDGDSHADTTTEIVHTAPHCSSRETYRHVMDGTSRSVFQGKIFVAEGAQKTDGFQLNQSLMLSPSAEVNAKPELEIYADDVKCSHGATSGRLDEEALFYLRSRGIPESEARGMLVEAFIGSSIDLISDEAVRQAFRKRASKTSTEEAFE